MIRNRCLVYISLLVATAILAIPGGVPGQASPPGAGAAGLGDEETLVMFVVPLKSSTDSMCLGDRFIPSVPRLSYITMVAAAGRHLLWCDVRAQWLNLKPGRRYALVLGEPEPDPLEFAAGGQKPGITFRSWEEGPEWYLDDFEVSEAMAVQLELQEKKAEWEEISPKKYEKRQRKMEKLLPEFALPVEFSKVFYRDGEDLQEVEADMRFRRKAKGWKSRLREGLLKIDDQAVEHESDSGTLRIAVSKIQKVAFAKLAGRRPWLLIQYDDGSHMRLAYLGTKAEQFNLVFMSLIEASEGRFGSEAPAAAARPQP